MVAYDALQELKPEDRHLRQDLSLIRNARAKHVIERRYAVCRHQQQVAANGIQVANLSARVQGQRREFCLEKCWQRGRPSVMREFDFRDSQPLCQRTKILGEVLALQAFLVIEEPAIAVPPGPGGCTCCGQRP